VIDAAVAATMSDPERNPHFRRRWVDETGVTSIPLAASPAEIGSFGLVLQEALERRRRAAAKAGSTVSAEEDPR
jgi:hypothetical protein